MDITELPPKEYGDLFPTPPHAYNSVAFNELNRYKVAAVHYLLIHEGKTKLGIVLGERAEGLFSPFSAPFGGFTTNRTPSLEHIDEAVKALKSYGENKGKPISITLPPPFYEPLLTNKTAHSLLRQGRIHHVDVNYHFPLEAFADYGKLLKPTAKRNLRAAQKIPFEFQKVNSNDAEGVRRAYEVIQKNHEEHGYPMRMTLGDVLKTIKIVRSDFFIVSLNGEDVAAAEVYHTTESICQLIYWGDHRSFSELRPMNGLAYFLLNFYHRQGAKIFDLGPATEVGVPNYGLCNFKENIGFQPTLKYSFEL